MEHVANVADVVIVTRFGEPSKMDTSPFATICKVANKPESFDIYLQISHDENDPNWTFMGTYSTNINDLEIIEEIRKILLTKQQ